MRRFGIGIGVATLLAVVAGLGVAMRSARIGEWEFGEAEWWGDVPHVTLP